MIAEKLSEKVKKNILDLQYNKYLQYYSTSIIALNTYAIGVGLAFVTNQVNYLNLNQMLAVFILSAAVISVVILLLLSYKAHMQGVLREVKRLDL